MPSGVGCKCIRIFRTNREDASLPFFKFQIVLAQLRHVPLAEWSGKTAVEHQQDICLSFEIGQAYYLTLEIRQGKVRSIYI